MKKRMLAVAGVLATLTLPALANPIIISTINGYYDKDYYDTPELDISNTTNFAFTNVVLRLTGYQGENKGVTQSLNLANIAPNSVYDFVWGSTNGYSLINGDLFSYDYDDSGGGSAAPNPLCIEGYQYCAYVGNFFVTLTATWNGKAIYSQFSPDPSTPSGVGNAAGVFVGWEGLDPNGLSETVYDSHSNGGPNGVLADIYEGTPPTVGSTGTGTTPEPSSFVLLGSGLIGLAGLIRRRLS